MIWYRLLFLHLFRVPNLRIYGALPQSLIRLHGMVFNTSTNLHLLCGYILFTV